MWYVSFDLTIKEELLDLVAIRKTTRGVDIKNALDKALTRSHVPLNKLVSVATDDAPAMVGKQVELIGLMKCNPNFPEFFPLHPLHCIPLHCIPIHCIIHREHLAAKHFRYMKMSQKLSSKQSILYAQMGKTTGNSVTLQKSWS